jgi:hypothetical protein
MQKELLTIVGTGFLVGPFIYVIQAKNREYVRYVSIKLLHGTKCSNGTPKMKDKLTVVGMLVG